MILKNSDLQIGNIIASGKVFNNTSTIGKVLEIGNDEKEFEQIYCECSESFEWFFKDNYCGVPLTEDLHNIFGVKKDGFLNFVYDISRFDIKNETCLVFSGDYLFLRDKINEPNSPPYDFITIWNKDIKKEFYVHEFQNLYKEITGKKLLFDFEKVVEIYNL